MIYSFYDPLTGLFLPYSAECSDDDLAARTPAGAAAMPGLWSPQKHRVIDGQVVAYQPPKPPDTEHHAFEWDRLAQRWVIKLTTAGKWAAIRAERDRRMAQTDWTQLPSTSEQTRDAWRPYRQALLDIPQLHTDPDSISWPSPPQ